MMSFGGHLNPTDSAMRGIKNLPLLVSRLEI